MSTDSDRTSLATLTLAALGVVFGDIGTSPLYALKTCFSAVPDLQPTPENVLGLLSLIFWALIAVISLKYVTVVLRADNRGEGGVLALTTLVLSGRPPIPRALIMALGLFGAVLGFAGSFAWKTRPLTSAMARKAGKRINQVRDGHWLTKHPINYG